MGEPIITTADLKAFAVKAVNLPRADAQEGRDRVNFLRGRLTDHIAEHPGFSLVKMLHAGSVAKGTALAALNDMDVVVYVRADEAPDASLVTWMTERLREVYGDTVAPDAVQAGTHCPTISFASGFAVDVVPILYEGDNDDRGYLIAKDTGDRLLTSVPLHLQFIRERKQRHPDNFAQVVRYLKWWIRECTDADASFKFKSFMAELIVAHLVDSGLGIEDHVAALADTFDYIATSGLAERIAFTDYHNASELPPPTGHAIEIFDPVNPENNIAFRYTESDRARIVEAADEALAAITEASYATTKGQAVACWQVVLGTRFKG
jgi:tRNA nucleotidyltransferase (CCA-adding enzyme)